MSRAKEANIDPKWFLATAICESGLQEKATNPVSGTQGIFQIHKNHKSEYKQMGINPLNYKDNIDYAIYLYFLNGKQPWLASADCAKEKIKTLALVDV